MSASQATAGAALVSERHPVDQVLPPSPLIVLGIQHVLVMYAGAVAVPLIIGTALKLPKDQITFLITCDLFVSGVTTLFQTIGVWRFGIRLPVIMGVTFAAVAPMVAMAEDPHLGALAIFGSAIAAGVFTIIVAPVVGRVLFLFPPVVTGSIISIIGLSLVEVGINWAAGGVGNAQFGKPIYLEMALLVLVVIVLINRFVRGFVRNISVLLGLIIGMIVATALGLVNYAGVGKAGWFDLVYPFHFGFPQFDPIAVITMCVVMIVVMIESLGMFLALGEITDRRLTPADLARGLRVDGLGTIIGGLFNSFPHTSFSQNVGLVAVTGVRSRWVCATGGIILILLGLIPKLAEIVASIPPFVLGGAGLVMFGMVAATGIRILAGVDLEENPNNLLIIAISFGFGLIPVVSHPFFNQLPQILAPILHSGILLSAVSAVALNAIFNGAKSLPKKGFQPMHAAHGAQEGPEPVAVAASLSGPSHSQGGHHP